MKRADISGPIGQAFAAHSAYTRIQNMFNLHPGRLKKNLSKLEFEREATLQERLGFLENAAPYVLDCHFHRILFDYLDDESLRFVCPSRPAGISFITANIVRHFLDLHPEADFKKIRAIAQENKIDPIELARYLRREAQPVLKDCLAELRKIVEQEAALAHNS